MTDEARTKSVTAPWSQYSPHVSVDYLSNCDRKAATYYRELAYYSTDLVESLVPGGQVCEGRVQLLDGRHDVRGGDAGAGAKNLQEHCTLLHHRLGWQSEVCRVQYTTVYTVYTVYSTLYTVHCTLYT